MKRQSEIEEKLERIANIWNYFIWEYKFCNSRITFTDEEKTNYFGNILAYFNDTLDIVFSKPLASDYSQQFSYNISFLQAIYIHQDFIEELLLLFRCGIKDDELKRDANYFINREIRNELVGHPLNRWKGKLISSTTFAYNKDKNSIVYLKYHTRNGFKFNPVTLSISEIQERHKNFLDYYFDKILLRLKDILNEFLIEVSKLEKEIEQKDFRTVLNTVELYFEAIFKIDFIYDKKSLLNIYKRMDKHPRYKNVIDSFYKDLRTALKETKQNVKELFNRKEKVNYNLQEKPIKIVIVDSENTTSRKKNNKKLSFHYEIGKLATQRNKEDFDFFSELLKSNFKKNQLVINELQHMSSNINNEVEYYSSLKLIQKNLKYE